jgi:hypothetical protein
MTKIEHFARLGGEPLAEAVEHSLQRTIGDMLFQMSRLLASAARR